MSSFKYIVPALAIAGGAAAATCSVDATTTIQNQGDATGLASCQTFTGSIAIATGTTDPIALDGVQEISGDLSASNVTGMSSLSSSSLTSIGGTFFLHEVTLLSSLNFPLLSKVANIDWVGLPHLGALSFTTKVQMAKSLSIQNTYLSSLDGIDLEVVDLVEINNNNYLTKIDMQLGNITDRLDISANGRNVSASFPNLIWANNLTVSNVTSFDSPSLASVNGSLGFYSNYFDSVAAPNLTSVGGSLSFVDCSSLKNISFPQLKTVGGGLGVENNTALLTIDGFPNLQTISGALDYYGNFTNASLPQINDIQGAFNMQSSGDISKTCDTFKPLSGQNNVIKGTFTCTGKVATPSSGPSGTGSSSSASGSASPSGAASPLQIPAMTGLLGVVAAVFGLL